MIGILIMLFVIALDQFTKAAAAAYFVDNGAIVVIEDVLGLTFTKNTGAAWGILSGEQLILCIVTGISIIVLAVILITQRRRKPVHMPALLQIAITLIIAGAIGNLIDRLWLGYVRDMIQTLFMDFPIFNVADCAVTIGAVLAIISVFITRSGRAYFSSLDAKAAEKNENKLSFLERIRKIFRKRDAVDTNSDIVKSTDIDNKE